MRTAIASWSNVLPTRTSLVDCHDSPWGTGSTIARGAGRSFGDAAYVTDGVTLSALALPAAARIDRDHLTVTCGAAMRVGQLHRVLEAAGLHFPVYGGTQWATVGGAVAADVHGKNDPARGSFGCHVESFLLDTPACGRVTCSRTAFPELFAATIGGMGLTGVVRSVTLRLRDEAPLAVHIGREVVASPAEMLARFARPEEDGQPSQPSQYCAWPRLSHPRARGLFCHAVQAAGRAPEPRGALEMKWPRVKLLNRTSAWALESLMPLAALGGGRVVHIRAFHYSGLHERFRHWNRFFGPRGFIEYHFVLPEPQFPQALAELLQMARKAGVDLLFAVVKRFGAHRREGMLSFPMEGFSLNFQTEASPAARRLLSAFTDLLVEREGRIYLAKDSVIDARQLRRMYGRLEDWRRVVQEIDPQSRIRSDLCARLEMKGESLTEKLPCGT